MAAELETFYLHRPLNIAHRGARDVAPENTLAAFRAAMDAGADGIELDVTRCATGEIVVIHDDTLDRTTDGCGAVGATPLEALRALDAGSWFSPDFAGERVPLLHEVLDLVAGQMRVNIEIKGHRLLGDGTEGDIAEMVLARGMENQVVVSSFNPAALWRMRWAAPGLQRGFLYGTATPIGITRGWAQLLARPQALHPHHTMLRSEDVRRLKARGYRVNAWTVNDAVEMQRMIALGVDGIITDHPAKLSKLLPV